MAWLGVRCWAKKIALVVVDDTGDEPQVTLKRRQPCPETDPGRRAAWFARMAVEALSESGSVGLAVRVADSAADQERAEAEGAVLAAAAEAGVETKRLRRQSLVKPLGVPRVAGAWRDFPRTDPFLKSLVGEERDAAMASLGGSRRP